MLYYVLQIATGKEERFCKNVKKLSSYLNSDDYEFIFITRELTIRREKKIFKEVKPLFTSYVFLKTKQEVNMQVLLELKKIPDFYKFLNSNSDIFPLNEKDSTIVEHFLKMMNPLKQIGESKVFFDENDRIVVVAGPLKGLEGNIIRVDRRKKRAKIQISIKDSVHTIDLSFVDISKDEI